MKKNLANQYRRYQTAWEHDLSDVYTTWSGAKARAYRYCLEDMERLGGERFRILSANSFQFTCGFEYPHPETGVLMFRVHTANNVYDWEVPSNIDM